MRFDWAYLCSDPRRLEMTLKFLPHIPELERLHVCYCSHFGQVTADELRAVLNQHRPTWLKSNIEDLTPYGVLMPEGLQKYFRNDRLPGGDGRIKTLGCKLAIPLIFNGPLLYTDDDVLVLKNPVDLWRQYGDYGNRGSFRLEGKGRDMLEDIVEAFDVPEWVEYPTVFDQHIIGAGIFFMHARDNWRYRLKRYSQCPYIARLSTRAREFFCLDQRFVTAFGIEHGWKQIGLAEGFRRTFLAGSRLPRNFFQDATFVHYGCAPKDKTKWVDLLDKEYQRRDWAYGCGPGTLAGSDDL